MKINLMVELLPMNYERVVIISSDTTEIEHDEGNINVYMDTEKAERLLALMAEKLGVDVVINGKPIEVLL